MELKKDAALEEAVAAITDNIIKDYDNDRDIDRLDFYASVDRSAIEDIVHKLRRIIYPGYYRDRAYYIYNARNNVAALIEDVTRQDVVKAAADVQCDAVYFLKGTGEEAEDA